ncbi:hypothetical protein [Enterococcus wangshanyuanii]|uniref:DUF4375 domain-containing protein n=1 Tax=Enterococcus wangshanyuanii TaxID=2005703 RepID=A0ABQ1PV31_9ENTE|nr:hypothetical protein [Enterococcus wangshanyuanii]GGD04333.1 hypothetical protein GCM10011573_37340 [Enterococcus wangshanyuanii]
MSDSLVLLLNGGWEFVINVNSASTLVYLYFGHTDTTVEMLINATDIPFEEILDETDEMIRNEIPDYYLRLLKEAELLNTEQENTLYRIQKEDVVSFLSNNAHEKNVLELFEKNFSCMEDVGYFVNHAESQLELEKRRDMKRHFEYNSES